MLWWVRHGAVLLRLLLTRDVAQSPHTENNSVSHIIGDSKGRYIKHTSRFGLFRGRIVLTTARRKAFIWSRERDAIRRLKVLKWRVETYDTDKSKAGDWEVFPL